MIQSYGLWRHRLGTLRNKCMLVNTLHANENQYLFEILPWNCRPHECFGANRRTWDHTLRTSSWGHRRRAQCLPAGHVSLLKWCWVTKSPARQWSSSHVAVVVCPANVSMESCGLTESQYLFHCSCNHVTCDLHAVLLRVSLCSRYCL